MKPVFDFKMPSAKMSLWTRIKLFFAKPYVAVDRGKPGETVALIMKRVDGVPYVVGEVRW